MVITENSLYEIVELLNENTSTAIVLLWQWTLLQVAWMGPSVTNDDQMCSVCMTHEGLCALPFNLCSKLPTATWSKHTASRQVLHVWGTHYDNTHTMHEENEYQHSKKKKKKRILSTCWRKAIKLGIQQLLSRPWLLSIRVYVLCVKL